MFGILQDLIQILFAYQQSWAYKLHLFLIILLGILIFYLIYLQYQIKDRQQNPKSQKCSQKVQYFDYITTKQRSTDEAVQKLQNSQEYKRYMAQKDNPNSRYNRYQEVEEIVLSDDSQEEGKKYK